MGKVQRHQWCLERYKVGIYALELAVSHCGWSFDGPSGAIGYFILSLSLLLPLWFIDIENPLLSSPSLHLYYYVKPYLSYVAHILLSDVSYRVLQSVSVPLSESFFDGIDAVHVDAEASPCFFELKYTYFTHTHEGRSSLLNEEFLSVLPCKHGTVCGVSIKSWSVFCNFSFISCLGGCWWQLLKKQWLISLGEAYHSNGYVHIGNHSEKFSLKRNLYYKLTYTATHSHAHWASSYLSALLHQPIPFLSLPFTSQFERFPWN